MDNNNKTDNKTPLMSDGDIARAHTPLPIDLVAQSINIAPQALIAYGKNKAKIDVTQLTHTHTGTHTGKLILVTAMSPTPAGEGKTTVLIGLSDAIRNEGHKTIVTIREPSLGPVMGIKGGAAGGGYSQIIPMEDINLHFTGDLHAITSATNTLAAIIDNHIHHGNDLSINPDTITWRRCLDVNDRSLRHITTGLGGPAHGTPQDTGFDITAASEIMAILCLAKNLEDLKKRLNRIVIGSTYQGQPVTVSKLKCAPALAALLKDALNPNLVQTLGGTPALVHGGPFANIAHGCNTLIATTTALGLADYVLTEAGFGSDLGAEKFFDIKTRIGNLTVSAAVIVCTLRSLKYNGGIAQKDLHKNNTDALQRGIVNLERHVSNMRKFAVEPIVAVNMFHHDSAEELAVLHAWAESFGVRVIETNVWAQGGQGAKKLAHAVIAATHTAGDAEENSSEKTAHKPSSHALYDPCEGIEKSIHTIATEIYGADSVQYSPQAQQDLETIKAHGWDTLPVSISKTQYSFSDDPKKLGAATGHTLHVRQLVPKIGAGFIVALTGNVMTLPGLPQHPAAEKISITDDGEISGIF